MLTCGEKGCLENTHWPNRSECWRVAQRCQKHYWGKAKTRYIRKKLRIKKEKCPCGCGRNE